MSIRHVCLICHNEIPHAGAECPHCKSHTTSFVGATPQLLIMIFAVMVGLFTVTGFLTRSFRQERRGRAQQYYHLAQTRLDYGLYEEAIRLFRESLSYAPEGGEARLGLAQALYYSGRFNEAENYLLDLREENPNSAVVNRLLARVAARDGEVEAATDYYRAAVYGRWPPGAEDNRTKTRFELVELLEQHGENMQAVSELLELLDEVPNDRASKEQVGRLFLAAGAPANAESVFQELLDTQPDDADVRAALGEAEFALGHYLSARTAFRRAQNLGFERPWLKERLALCNEIIDLDPTLRGLGRVTRLDRSRQLVERALAVIENCHNPAAGPDFVGPRHPFPPALVPLREQAQQVAEREIRGRATDENVEANLILAEEIWRRRKSVCSEEEIEDQALGHVLAKLAR